MELALAILREKPDPSTAELRGWAINVVNPSKPSAVDAVLSPVELTDKADTPAALHDP